MPTVLAALAVESDHAFDGRDWTGGVEDGRSLLAEAAMGRASYGWSTLRGPYEANLKLIDGVEPELYDLASDPREQTELAVSRPDDLVRMRTRLQQLLGDGAERFPDPEVALGSDELSRLHALGYVVGPGTGAAARAGPNPRDFVPLIYQLYDLEAELARAPYRGLLRRMLLTLSGQPVITTREDLIAAYEDVAAESPDFAPAHLFIAHQQRIAGRTAEAERSMKHFEETLGRPAGKWIDFQAR